MKKLITVFAFASVILLGVQSISAQSLSQDNTRPEVIAKTETAQLTDALNLDGDQSRAVFRALVSKEVSYQKSVSGKDPKDAGVIGDKKRIDAQLKASMKKALTAEQYAKWEASN